MGQITSREELEAWLTDKPADWASAISARGALRVLPYAFTTAGSDAWLASASLTLFRGAIIAFSANSFPEYDHKMAARAASNANYAASNADRFGAFASARAIANAADAVNDRGQPSRTATAYVDLGDASWTFLSEDCNQLQREGIFSDSRLLMSEKLFLVDEPDSWRIGWQAAIYRLLALDPTYQVWIDWYNRRIEGHDAAFAIPGDTRRVEDKKILTRLADATNEDFWGKGATHVNTTLQGWIEEARARVKPPSVIDPNLEPLPQNPDALVWQSDEASRIGVDALSGADALDYSDEARDRHSEARDEAQRVRALCATSDAAYEIGGLLDRYLEAMGETIEGVRPGLFVQRGERLRQALTSRIADGNTSNYGPLPDQVRDGLKGWQSAHNAFVGLDAKLARIDSALYGPDARRIIVPPDEIRAVAKSADEATILQPGGREALEGAAAIAPTPPDPDDRRSRLSSESSKNFGRKIIDKLWPYVVGGLSIEQVYGLAKWAYDNRDWFLKNFADDPTMLPVVERVIDFLSKLPLA